MTDLPDDDAPALQASIKRALEMKTKMLEAKAKPPRGGRFQRERAAAAHSSSRSKPWMKA